MNILRKLVILLLFELFLFPAYSNGSVMPRPEHPRPQFERDEWVNLNGEWTFEFDFVKSGKERGNKAKKGFDQQIIVPFCPESKLSGVEHTDFITAMWYHRQIAIPQSWKDKKILLNFGAVYYMAEIYIDGQFADRHFGGSSSFSVDITRYVRAGEKHNLVVYVENDLRGMAQSAGKSSLKYAPYGCVYARTTGIWQTVWMEAIPTNGLKSAHLITDIDNERIIVRPEFYSESNGTLRVSVNENGKTIATEKVKADNSATVVLNLKKSKWWSPESPYLYDIVYELTDKNGKQIDRVNSYAGMRKIHIEGNMIYLNNKPCYQRLVLDQGYYPEGLWTAPTDEDLKQDILLSKAAGFNGGRLHQKVFEERFHYWADKLGYLTWGEAASWGMDCNNIEAIRNFMSEWAEVVVRDRNHPSIVMWTPQNEAWHPDQLQYPRFISDLYNLTKSIDSTRPFHGCSGGVHVKTDIYSVHNYQQDPEKLRAEVYNAGKLMRSPNNVPEIEQMNVGFNPIASPYEYTYPHYDGIIPYLLDEFGGILWTGKERPENSDSSWGYGHPPGTLNEFYDRLEKQVDAVLGLSPQVWGYCYTQLTDVMQEQNGIYYYDRTPKFDMKKIHKIFSKNPLINN